TSPGPTWSTATTPCTRTTPCCCAGTSIHVTAPVSCAACARRSRVRRGWTSSTLTTSCRPRRSYDVASTLARGGRPRARDWRRRCRRAVAVARRLLPECRADDAARRARALLRSDQGTHRRHRADLHELPVRVSARDGAAPPGPEAARRSEGKVHLLLLDQHRPGARHPGGDEGVRGEVPGRPGMDVPDRQGRGHRTGEQETRALQ